ncbi:MAG: CRISPR-associated endonuclease Cas1 [Planctomycetes bacterium]|nr:CRISPR-associated endonuclease Cas1 [Planctomycetota bacterium]
MNEVPLMPVRRLQNYAYCPRLCYLQWVEGIFEGNADTAEGELAHRAIDRPTRLPADFGLPEGTSIRSLTLSSTALGLIGVVDCLIPEGDGYVVVDCKKGSARRDAAGNLLPKEADALQVAAYAMLVREAGERVVGARIWYATDRRHVPVELHDAIYAQVLAVRDAALRDAQSGRCPPPLIDDPRCLFCSAYPVCLPNESAWWSGLISAPPKDLRPPRPEADEGVVVLVQEPRARVGFREGQIVVEVAQEPAAQHPIEQVSSIHLYGPVQISAQAMHACLERGIPVAWFAPSGRFLGISQGLPVGGVDARRGQYRLFEDPDFRLHMVRAIVRAKIHNQRVLLQRNGREVDKACRQLAEMRDACDDARDIETLRGLEGAAAAAYFASFAAMLRDQDFDFTKRERRPPRDPVNAVLSLGYAMLAKELTGICIAVGLDPLFGFFHSPRYGRPALALDMMEEFRPLLVDSVAISLFNRGELAAEDFIRSAQGTFLNDAARKTFWKAWFRRLDTPCTHPEFGYQMSYRRMLEVQVRQVWRLCRGEARRYFPFTTR